MCYIFKSLMQNMILHKGDTIALGAPIFTPHLEMPHLSDYELHIVQVNATQENRSSSPTRAQEAGGSQDQDVLPGESGEPVVRRGQRRRPDEARHPGQDQAARPAHPDR